MSVSETATIDEAQEVSQTLTLDELAEKSAEELDNLYRSASAPKSIADLDGKPTGRVLALRATGGGILFNLVKRITRVESFIWGGISFQSKNKKEGAGINRIKLSALGNHNLFPFDTKIEKSVIDDKDCVYLEYDKPQNPWLVRKIRDELREVSPGLFLGPAMWKDSKNEKATLALWFALDTNVVTDEF